MEVIKQGEHPLRAEGHSFLAKIQWLKKLVHVGAFFAFKANCGSMNKAKLVRTLVDKAKYLDSIFGKYHNFNMLCRFYTSITVSHNSMNQFCALANLRGSHMRSHEQP